MEISDNVKVTINQDKINDDEKWDGLKGYITNITLPAADVYQQYKVLWVVERAYRITKGTLEMRPMFHYGSFPGFIYQFAQTKCPGILISGHFRFCGRYRYAI